VFELQSWDATWLVNSTMMTLCWVLSLWDFIQWKLLLIDWAKSGLAMNSIPVINPDHVTSIDPSLTTRYETRGHDGTRWTLHAVSNYLFSFDHRPIQVLNEVSISLAFLIPIQRSFRHHGGKVQTINNPTWGKYSHTWSVVRM